MCNCSQSCVANSLHKNNPDLSCDEYDLTELFDESSYVDCNFLGKKVVDGKLVDLNKFSSLFELIKKIDLGVKNLCESDFEFEKLMCDSLEYRDGCSSQPECQVFDFKDIEDAYCNNKEYNLQIDKIRNLLKKSVRPIHEDVPKTASLLQDMETSNVDEIHEEHINDGRYTFSYDSLEKYNSEPYECINDHFLNLQEFGLLLDHNNMPHIILKRDLEGIRIPELNKNLSEVLKQNLNFKLSNIQDRRYYSMVSLSIISTVLFSILALLKYKDNTNSKRIMTAMLLTLTMLFVSFYSSLIID